MALKRRGSAVSKDEERVSKRRLRSGRTIEALTSPLRPAKEVTVNASVPGSRNKSFTSAKSAIKIARIVDDEDISYDKICLTPIQQSQNIDSCLNAQKRAILRILQRPSVPIDKSDSLFSVNEVATRQLADLLEGTTIRAEGNSCILLGPRGSGKSRVSGLLFITLTYFIVHTAN